MILQFDAGNTFLKWRIEGQGTITRVLNTELAQGAMPELPDGVATVEACSVSGSEVRALVNEWVEQRYGFSVNWARTEAAQAGVTNSYQRPSDMGVDRWLAMLAGFNQIQAPVCVVSCGTAITIDWLSATGKHQGGYIIPGVGLLPRALFADTAQVKVKSDPTELRSTPGVSTEQAVRFGANLVFEALAKSVAAEVVKRQAALVVTGGDGERFVETAGMGDYQEGLVLDGLRWALR